MRLHSRTRFSLILTTRGGRNGLRLAVLSALGLALGAHAHQANAQTSLYFDVNGTGANSGVANNGNYSWEGNVWNTSTTAGNTTAPSAWVDGSSAMLVSGADGAADNYTITASTNHTISGLRLNATGGGLVQVSGPGVLTLAGTGYSGFYQVSSTQTLQVNAVLAGTGGVQQHGSGSLSLYGNNTYTGGTNTTGGQILAYNNANSFGTGAITLNGTGGQAFVNGGASGMTIANNFVFATVGSSTNLVGGSASGAAPGTTFSGTFTMPSSGSTLINTSSVATTVDVISGVISGGSALSIADLGTLILSGANTYTGSTTLSGTATLKLGAANTIASTSSLILGKGTLNPDGFNQSMTATTLGLTSTSTIDFSVGASEMDFANSSGLTWVGSLNLVNYTAGLDALNFGSATGLTSAQLADIEFNGVGLGTASLDAKGNVIQASAGAPEPSSWALLGTGAMTAFGVIVRKRRRGANASG